MNLSKKTFIITGCIAAFALGQTSVIAQANVNPANDGRAGGPRWNFSPQAIMAGLRSQLVVPDDSKWAAVSEKIFAVWDAQRATMGFGAGPRRGPRLSGDDAFGPDRRAEAALQIAVKENVSDAGLKAVLSEVQSTVRGQQRARRQAYAKAQDDLRLLLNARQEAQLTLAGVLQ